MMSGDVVTGFEPECLHSGWWLALTPRDEFSERSHAALRGGSDHNKVEEALKCR